MSTKRGVVYGWDSMQVWLVGANGIAYGSVGDSATNGTTTHAVYRTDVQTAGLPNPARVIATATGGNRLRGQHMFGVNELGNFEITVQDMDGTLDTLFTGGQVDEEYNARWKRWARNTNRANLPQVGMMLTSIIQSSEEASDGEEYYLHYIILRSQVDPGWAQMAYQATGNRTLRLAPTLASKDYTGAALSSSTQMKISGGREWAYAMVTPNPIAITTHVSATGTDTFNLGYLPLFNTPGDASGGVDTANLVYKNAANAAVTTINTSTAAVAMTGLNADIYVVTYETEFAAVA